MKEQQAPAAHPAFLPVGTVVGSWRIVGWAGGGVYGAVFRAVRAEADEEQGAGSVALKVALHPGDQRFAREVEVLSRTRHPSIPRLWDNGEWQHPNGAKHPYLVMDWVDGVALYEWAVQQRPSSQQVLRVLSQLASALQAVHAQGALHRDVKGANVLVRRKDGVAVLTDFGSGIYPGAPLLTPRELIPGTPAYHSPEAELFPLRFMREPTARYVASPADDLYALGVTAYRLVTGQYPEFGEPFKDATGFWQPGPLGSPAPSLLNPRVEERLNAQILRMLASHPEERGTAAQLAQEMQHAAQHPVAQSSQPLVDAQQVLPPAGVKAEAQPQVVLAKKSRPALGWPSLVAMAAGLALGVWASGWEGSGDAVESLSMARKQAGHSSQPQEDTSGLAEAASAVCRQEADELTLQEVMAEDELPEPMPGQAVPDAKGRCPHKRQVALNGGCWKQLKLQLDECDEWSGQLFNDTCYVPVLQAKKRRPTSAPPHKQ